MVTCPIPPIPILLSDINTAANTVAEGAATETLGTVAITDVVDAVTSDSGVVYEDGLYGYGPGWYRLRLRSARAYPHKPPWNRHHRHLRE